MRKSKQKYKHRVEGLHTEAIFRDVCIDRNSIKHMDNQQRVFEKQQEIEDLSNVSKWEDAKQEKQHLTEENERLKQELRAVKIQLSKQPGSYSYGYTLGTLSCVRYKVGFHRLPFSLYRRLSVDRQALVPLKVGSFPGYCLNNGIFVCSHHFIYCW